MQSAAKSFWIRAAVLVLLTVAAYTPAIPAGFVFDDSSLIVENRLVHQPIGLFRFWFTTQMPDYYPLTWSLWWGEWRLWGSTPMGYHVVNILLHAGNAVLVWIILRRLKIIGAWVAALVFAVHPVSVATVAWISEQKNTLSMLLFLMSILLYLRYDQNGQRNWYILSWAAYLLALLSKSAVVMLPIVLLACLWWTHGRISWKDLGNSSPFFALSLGFALVTIWFQHNRALVGHIAHPPAISTRLAVMGWVPWFYAFKAWVPANLTVVYPKWRVDASNGVAWLPGARRPFVPVLAQARDVGTRGAFRSGVFPGDAVACIGTHLSRL
jgi:hypothetical protein